MIGLLLALGVGLTPTNAAPIEGKMSVVGASMFKNGYVVVLREMPTPTSGEYVIKQIPVASLGTLWITTSEGTKLDSVINTMYDATEQTINIGTVDALLGTNVGKTFTFELHDVVDKKRKITGKLLSMPAEHLLIQLPEGTLQTIRRSDIITISSNDKLVYTTSVKPQQRGLRFDVRTPGNGKVYMISLERGATWAPAYAIDMTKPEELTVTAKATVVNELEEMNNAELRFITGFPNIRFAGINDPLTMPENIERFTGSLQGMGGGPGGGGFGGGGRAGEMMNQRAPNVISADQLAAAMDTSDGTGMQAGDLFFYSKPNLTLKKGDRGYYVLFDFKAPYKEIYTWIVNDHTESNVEYRFPSGEPGEVWHSVRFKNTSGKPLTTAAGTSFKHGQIIGQDMVSYTSPNAEVEVKITKALDIRVERQEEEVKREPGFVFEKYWVRINGQDVEQKRPKYDRITIKGTLVIRNQKNEKLAMKVAKHLTGETTAVSHGGTTLKTVLGLHDVNPTTTVTWNLDVNPGKTVNLTYTFTMLVKPM